MTEQGLNTAKSMIRRAFGVATLGLCGAGLAIALPGHSAAAEGKKVSVSFDPTTSFTPTNADSRLAASFAGQSPRDFAFTPAGMKRKPSQVRVALRAASSQSPLRVTGSKETRDVAGKSMTSTQLTPASYNLGVAVGWKRFAVSGDVAQSRSAVPDMEDRDSARVGLAYNAKKFTGRVAVSADRKGSPAPVVLPQESYSLDVGGALKISRNIAVTGGVRYRIDQERVDEPVGEDTRRDSQAVYVGTAFKF
ncbi:hypothetical protein [Sphingomicrobium nitratireducens]|uniref:hypothetical protein n=1 Tax=Sphingomicrobium nitratireducens TaxID=2964666 RepID=UPI00223EF7F7|nr:hypothetical protein [Sphingomicrobium nitratireducens]